MHPVPLTLLLAPLRNGKRALMTMHVKKIYVGVITPLSVQNHIQFGTFRGQKETTENC